MKRSTDRILTTHVGSLPRPDDLLDQLQAAASGTPVAAATFDATVRKAVKDIVDKQTQIGVDVINDGEQGKPSFVNYINDRLAGLTPRGLKGSSWNGSREMASFPAFYQALGSTPGGANTASQMVVTGPLAYTGQARLKAELELFRSNLAGKSYAEAFVPSISVTNVEDWLKNDYYKTGEEFLAAIADAMHEEYKAIVDAGFLLQVDDPQLATYYMRHPEVDVQGARRWAAVRVEALNHALRGIPEERVRHHTCYSINIGPRIHDMELKDIVDLMLRVKAGAYSFEAANPRHEHEWKLWKEIKLPAGKSIVPGVISHATVVVEHPELVAERIVRYASVVGRENVIAGADCGFASFAISKDSQEMQRDIVWHKLVSLVEGARLATKQLWGGAS